MDLFITSKIGATVNLHGKRVVGRIDNKYGFLTCFQKALRRYQKMLYISSTPDENEKVSDWFENTVEAFGKEQIHFRESILVNGENADKLDKLISDADVIFLSGGHLPTQNRFFQQIGLKSLLHGFRGIIVAQSAGSMNCAETVYVCPEIPGEATDPAFQRFRPGLALTDISVIPHYISNQSQVLDGKRLYEEIIYPDTFTIPLYLLTDGSFIYEHSGIREFFGEIFRYYQGEIKPVMGM